jgi:hypothetical protein
MKCYYGNLEAPNCTALLTYFWRGGTQWVEIVKKIILVKDNFKQRGPQECQKTTLESKHSDSLILSSMMYLFIYLRLIGPGSAVGIATAYGLDDPGIESRWGRHFPHLSRPGLRPT